MNKRPVFDSKIFELLLAVWVCGIIIGVGIGYVMVELNIFHLGDFGDSIVDCSGHCLNLSYCDHELRGFMGDYECYCTQPCVKLEVSE